MGTATPNTATVISATKRGQQHLFKSQDSSQSHGITKSRAIEQRETRVLSESACLSLSKSRKSNECCNGDFLFFPLSPLSLSVSLSLVFFLIHFSACFLLLFPEKWRPQ
ncbi:hypothetical protein LOK49_LG04G02641 [Camellia lanceoleosa]|uniref:Uncharacterized protein n=1 Tax=Camellia lanceoleosa TaxID=1840588 RepID=A0ACC0I569_9ERIC|nr:hypothetical protein LOK49_LG04G02641 [Camellia lanceoleosa]